jgi:hypothetical protein
MEVHFTPEQEAQLSQIANLPVRDAERLVKEPCAFLSRTVSAPLCRRASRRPTAGNSSKSKRWTRASNRCLIPDAYPLDASRRSGLAKHPRIT